MIFFIAVIAISKTLAQQVDQTAYQKYIDIKLYDQMVPGYYIAGNKKIEINIKYVEPINLQNAKKHLVIDKGNGVEDISKSKIDAFSLNDQIYIAEKIDDSVIWVMLNREGAIRETIYLKPVPDKHPTYYKINHLVTNTTTHEGIFVGSLAVNFSKTMANLTRENAELSQKIKDREEGYHFINFKKIIAEYNLWFQNEYPKRVKYIGDIPDFQAIIEKDMAKFQPKH